MVTPGRRHTHGKERGAAVFIVVMVITLLTALGVFAIRSASMVNTATGYDRQASQTAYLSELAGRSAAAELAGAGKSQMYLNMMMRGAESCPANAKLAPIQQNAPVPCYKLDSNDLSARVQENAGPVLIEKQTEGAPGTLGPPLGDAFGNTSGVEGVFLVEMIEAFRSEGNAGYDRGGGPNSFFNVQVTVTAHAQVRATPSDGGNAWCAENSSSVGASVRSLRAHITLPNMHQ